MENYRENRYQLAVRFDKLGILVNPYQDWKVFDEETYSEEGVENLIFNAEKYLKEKYTKEQFIKKYTCDRDAFKNTRDCSNSSQQNTSDPLPSTTEPQELVLDPEFSCLEKYYNTLGRKIYSSTPNYISVFTKSKKNIWVFGKNKYWGQYNLEQRKIDYNGKWECDGNSNFLINATDGDKYNSRTGKWVTVEPPEQIQPDIIQPDIIQPDIIQPDGTQPTPTTPTTSPGQKCTAITDSTITKQFENENSLLKYPYDRNYRYKKIGGDWFAKNINNKKVFNITKCGYTTSVEKLNKEFPSGS
jgi:hypothetical protein